MFVFAVEAIQLIPKFDFQADGLVVKVDNVPLHSWA
jgi:hypothetical protein